MTKSSIIWLLSKMPEKFYKTRYESKRLLSLPFIIKALEKWILIKLITVYKQFMRNSIFKQKYNQLLSPKHEQKNTCACNICVTFELNFPASTRV